jgi:hypothetical protein
MLTPAQYASLKADILASGDMNTQPMTSAGAAAIAALYNAASNQDVWRTDANVNAIYDAIDWTKFTPADAVDSTVTYSNRLLLIQTKQMNLQNMLQGRTTVDASRANLRAGLRDAVTNLPAGSSGAAISAGGAGGAAVLNALTRKATRFEKLFATQSAATGTVSANILVIEGVVSGDDIQVARES